MGGSVISAILRVAVAIAVLATVSSTLSVYPHELAYFNEASGGPENGHRHLLHSHLNWGQDLLHVRDWIDANHPQGPLFLSYDNDGSPASFDVQYDVHLEGWNARQNLIGGQLAAGTYLISKGCLLGYDATCPVETAAQLRKRVPAASIGYTFLVYRVDDTPEQNMAPIESRHHR